MPTAEKIATIDEMTEAITTSNAIVLADFTGLDVASVTELRNQCREASVNYQVVKNRLAKRAVEAAGIPGLEEFLAGPTAMAFAQEDPLAPAKVLQKFIDAKGRLVIKSGFFDGQILTPDQVEALAKLPSREELLSKVAGTIQGPLFNLAGVLNGLLSKLVGVLAEVEKKMQTGDSGPESGPEEG